MSRTVHFPRAPDSTSFIITLSTTACGWQIR